jgi:N utilization substance protein A
VIEPTEPANAGEPSAVSIEDEEKSLDSLFKLRPEVFTEAVSSDEEDDDELGPKKGAKAKKKKRKFTEMEYDPDRDVMVVKKKRKRGTGEWEDTWDL